MAPTGFSKILIAHDGSEGANKALAASIDLAKRFQSELHLISIEEHLPHYALGMVRETEKEREESRYFQEIVEKSRVLALKQGVTLHPHILPGHEVDTIVRFARDHKIDLLVLGFTGHSNIFTRIWGSTSQSLTQLASCQVLVVK
jgi:nucleotide-binding universal stress UspA family protein